MRLAAVVPIAPPAVARTASAETRLAFIVSGTDGYQASVVETGATVDNLKRMKLLGVEPDWVRGTNGELADAIKGGRTTGFIKSAVYRSNSAAVC